MEKYKQSLMDYSDVISVTRQSRKEGREEGREEGRKEGRKEGREEGIAIGEKRGEKREQARTVKWFRNQGKSIKEIAELLGFTEEQVYNLLE